MSHNIWKIQVVFQPSIVDNLKHWKFFNDDAQILRSLQSNKEFLDPRLNFLVESINLRIKDSHNEKIQKGVVPMEYVW